MLMATPNTMVAPDALTRKANTSDGDSTEANTQARPTNVQAMMERAGTPRLSTATLQRGAEPARGCCRGWGCGRSWQCLKGGEASRHGQTPAEA
jgi:hypothetical protein